MSINSEANKGSMAKMEPVVRQQTSGGRAGKYDLSQMLAHTTQHSKDTLALPSELPSSLVSSVELASKSFNEKKFDSQKVMQLPEVA